VVVQTLPMSHWSSCVAWHPDTHREHHICDATGLYLLCRLILLDRHISEITAQRNCSQGSAMVTILDLLI
jgi:hypothetical protein